MRFENFRRCIENSRKEHSSNIILALDYKMSNSHKLLLKCKETIRILSPHICAIKLNKHLTLPLGLYYGIAKLIAFTRTFGLPLIMDCKINDIGATNRETVHHYYDVGFDAVTASPFIGWEKGLDSVFQLAKEVHKGVILLVYMSHEGAVEGYAQRVIDLATNREKMQYQIFAEKALKWDADGVVVGATHPQKISEINEIMKGKVPIYSPGIGVQGGNVESAVKCGATYLIIGRSILYSKDPLESVKTFKEKVNRCLE